MERVNYSDFVRQVSKHTGFTIRDVAEVLDSAQEIIIENLKSDKSTKVLKGLEIEPQIREEREGFNPSAQEKMILPRKRFARAKVTMAIKNHIN